MIRVLSLLFALGVLAATSTIATAATAATELQTIVHNRASVIVDDDVVRLGDLFDGAGEKADVAVAYAPEPGGRTTFNARWLYRIARAHGLSWQPRSRTARTVVERTSIIVPPAEVENRILTALADRGVAVDGRRVDFGRHAPEVHLPADPDAELAIETVAYDPRRDRFAAVLTTSGDGGDGRRTRITGQLREMTDVPVPVRRLRAGEIIGRDDLEFRTMQTRRLPNDAVFDVRDLIGQTPRRGLREGAPVRSGEVRSPVVVGRGDLVTIVLAAPQMLLTARGRALEEGGREDVIRVRNLKSRGIIEGRVTGAGQVAVGLGPDLAPDLAME